MSIIPQLKKKRTIIRSNPRKKVIYDFRSFSKISGRQNKKKKAMKSGELSAMVDNIHGSVKGVSNSIFSGKSSKRRSLLG